MCGKMETWPLSPDGEIGRVRRGLLSPPFLGSAPLGAAGRSLCDQASLFPGRLSLAPFVLGKLHGKGGESHRELCQDWPLYEEPHS